MSLTVKNPDAFKWKCGRCETWNPIERGTCKYCGAMAQQYASAYRVHSQLTTEEQQFYNATAPYILSELRSIKAALHAILDSLTHRGSWED